MTDQQMKERGWVRVSVWLPPELAGSLAKAAPPGNAGRNADKYGQGRSSFVRRAIRRELERIESQPAVTSTAAALARWTAEGREPE
jgi:metal-responsive CopG/Arc/MetJ family transcriptional regulator